MLKAKPRPDTAFLLAAGDRVVDAIELLEHLPEAAALRENLTTWLERLAQELGCLDEPILN